MGKGSAKQVAYGEDGDGLMMGPVLFLQVAKTKKSARG